MRCPYCRVDNDRVIDSRGCQDGAAIRRRRECLKCHRRYTTYERAEEPNLVVVKKDGGRMPFERGKIRVGLVKACWKRPIHSEQIDALIADVETEAAAASLDGEIASGDLGDMVMERLKDLDHVAFVRFASVYRQFADIDDFVNEIRPFLGPAKPRKTSERSN